MMATRSVLVVPGGTELAAERWGLRAALDVVRDYVSLTKPRIVLLLVVTGYAAMVVAAGGLPPIGLSLAAMFGLALSAGGANAVNMWYDRDIDRIMTRTRRRPVAAGRMRPASALAFGITSGVAAVLLLARAVNWESAGFAAAGYVYYVVVYTMWLKRRTPQNIVIGGGAGAIPPLVGWAAVAGRPSLAAWLMFGVIFLWTPPHFWSLALYKDQDYRAAGVPMMPSVRGWASTKRQAFWYALALGAASLALYWTHAVGRWYLAAAGVLAVAFILHTLALWRERAPEVRWAKATFRFSLVYLTGLFAAMVLDLHR